MVHCCNKNENNKKVNINETNIFLSFLSQNPNILYFHWVGVLIFFWGLPLVFTHPFFLVRFFITILFCSIISQFGFWFILICFGNLLFQDYISIVLLWFWFSDKGSSVMGSILRSIAQNNLMTTSTYNSIIFKNWLVASQRRKKFNTDIFKHLFNFDCICRCSFHYWIDTILFQKKGTY